MQLAVVGGGVGGLAASIALRNAGFSTEVFERAPRFGDIGVGVILSPNGIRALDALGRGIGEAVREQGRCLSPAAAHPVSTPDGATVGAIRYGEFQARHGAPFVVIRRMYLHRILREAHGPDGLHGGAELVDVQQPDEGGVVAQFADRRRVRADVLVGADGLRSKVRAVLFGDEPPRYVATTLRGITCGQPLRGEFADGFTVVGSGLGMFFAPMGDAELYWTATINADQGAWPRDPEASLARLLERLQGWPPLVSTLVRGVDHSFLVATDLADRPPLTRWSTDRVTLLGDAAHAMTNFLGQGANTTLEDAVVLARCLAADGEHGLEAYERERLERTTRIVLGSATLLQGEWSADTVTRFQGYLENVLNGELMDWVYSYVPSAPAAARP